MYQQCRRSQCLEEDSIAAVSAELKRLESPDHSDRKLCSQNVEEKAISCENCSQSVRVKNVSELSRGQHIEMPGHKKSTYDENKKRRTWIYTHHAIVTDIIARKNSQIDVELIHMSEYKGKHKLLKTTETYDLQYDELYIIHYYYPRYPPELIAKRAEDALEKVSIGNADYFRKYHLLTSNCEHFAVWCVVSDTDTYESQDWARKMVDSLTFHSFSRQIMKWKSRIVEACRYLFGHGSAAMRFILKFIHAGSDEISAYVSSVIPDFLPSGKSVLAGASSVYVLYCIIYTAYLFQRKRNKSICKDCYDGKIAEIWTKLSIYGITSAVTFFMVQGSVNMPVVIGSLGLIVLSIALQYYVPKIRKMLLAPYCCSKKGIRQIDELEIADIATIYYYGLPHDILITEIHPDNDSGKCKLRAVHYATENIMSKRTIREEYFDVNITFLDAFLFWRVKRHECQHLPSYPPEITISRARKRIGEQKWQPITNRSDHLCYWAKISEPALIENDKSVSVNVRGQTKSSLLSSWFIAEKEVHLSEEIEIGDIIRYRGQQHCVIEKAGNERNIVAELAYVRRRVVEVGIFRIDLNTDSVQVLVYHPVHCYDKPTRAQRAKNLKGKRRAEAKFKEECILKLQTRV